MSVMNESGREKRKDSGGQQCALNKCSDMQ